MCVWWILKYLIIQSTNKLWLNYSIAKIYWMLLTNKIRHCTISLEPIKNLQEVLWQIYPSFLCPQCIVSSRLKTKFFIFSKNFIRSLFSIPQPNKTLFLSLWSILVSLPLFLWFDMLYIMWGVCVYKCILCWVILFYFLFDVSIC